MTTFLKAPCAAALALLLMCSSGVSQICLDTLFASNNGGSAGGAVYFNVEVAAPGGITVTNIQTNTSALVPFTVTIYRANGTHVGIEGMMAMWSIVSTGNGIGLGTDQRTPVDVTDFNLPAGINGIAIVMSATASHRYTNGTGANQVYPDPNITIRLGSAGNVPFTTVFTPRVWNGQLCYNLVGPSGVINSPAPAAVVSGSVPINFDVDHALGTPVSAFFEYSTDAGLTFFSCTPTPPSMNPIVGITVPATGQIFDWNSIADGVGLAAPAPTTIRMGVSDGMATALVAVDVVVDNVVPPPTCTLALSGASPATRDISFDLLTDTPSGSGSVDAFFEYSLDGGVTFFTATAAATSSNPLVGVPSGTPTVFIWDSRADSVGLVTSETNVQMRATVTDAAAFLPGTCATAIFEVDNTALCQAICGDCDLNGIASTIIDALSAAQFSAGIGTPTMVQMGCCDVDSSMTIAIIDSLVMAQISAGLPGMVMCP